MRKENAKFDKDGSIKSSYIDYVKFGDRVLYPKVAVVKMLKKLSSVKKALK